MSDKKHAHLWIPEEEISKLENVVTGRDVDVPVNFSDHGIKILSSLNVISEFHRKRNSPIVDELIIFKVKLYQNQKIANKNRKEFIEKSGLDIKYVRNNETIIVSTTPSKFELLQRRAQVYQEKNRYSDFQYIDSFDYIGRNEKISVNLRKFIQETKKDMVDIEIQLLPNFKQNIYEKSLTYLSNIIKDSDGELLDEVFYLSDHTPVIRALVDPSIIDILSEEEIILMMENTNFFGNNTVQDINNIRYDNVVVDPNVSFDDIPIIGILDSGVDFGTSELGNFVVERFMPTDITKTNIHHGTGCAFRAMFGNEFSIQKGNGVVNPRVRIVDGVISNGIDKIPTKIFIKRIRLAIQNLKQYTTIFNLSFNSDFPIDGSEMSLVGYELDSIMEQEKVQFIISAGNHKLYRSYNDLNDIIDDDDSRISTPADSVLGITVGSYCLDGTIECVSEQNDIGPYSRVGFGLGGHQKPDLVAPGGNVFYDITNKVDIVPDCDPALLPLRNGFLTKECGTSFSAPIIAGDLAIIKSIIPTSIAVNDDTTLLAKVLLLHTSSQFYNLDDLDQDEKEAVRKAYGHGKSNLDKAMFSEDSRVTFLRSGMMDFANKQRVRFYMPTDMAGQDGLRTCKVTVTCAAKVPFRKDKGTEYISAYIGASLKKIDTKYQLKVGNPKHSDGRAEWVAYQHFTNVFSSFNPGDWQIWLQMHKRWGFGADEAIEYALAITIEDLTGNNNIYESIVSEAHNRFRPISEIRVRV